LTTHRSINRRYTTLAGELGLGVVYMDRIGWSATSVPDQTAARHVEVLAELGAALVLWRRADQASSAGSGRSRNALACSSGCGRRIRRLARCWSWPPSSSLPAPNPSSPRTTRSVDAYQRVSETRWFCGFQWFVHTPQQRRGRSVR
jgi:hypothetical protein